MSSKSALLTERLARKAIGIVRPAIELLLADGKLGGKGIYVVIVDPTFPSGNPDEVKKLGVNGSGIVFECPLGSLANPKRSRKIAIAKARLSLTYQMPTYTLQACRPWVLQKGDTYYDGSASFDGLVVGVSGVDGRFDQMFAWLVLQACWALCMRSKDVVKRDGHGFVK
jgi:hypothetical protein